MMSTLTIFNKLNRFWKLLGPGILYAGAAIGVSHLVQSTRAGALYGTDLLWAVVLANLIKYPFFKLGAGYTIETKECLLDGYKKIGKWAVFSFLLITISTMFIIQSAITLVTTGIFYNLLGISISLELLASLILIFSVVILILGRLKILNSLMKIVVLILSGTTIFAVITSFPMSAENIMAPPSFEFRGSHLAFLIALMGWMPAPLDLSVWQSQWYKDMDSNKSVKDKYLDFNIGYMGTAILAIVFVLLGKNIMYGKGSSFSPSAVGFTTELINLYGSALGDTLKPILGICVLTTMISTTLTCLDAFPRVIKESLYKLDWTEKPLKRSYNISLLLLCVGTIIIISFFKSNMKALVDFATTLSFLVTPLFCFLNYRAWTIEKLELTNKYRLCIFISGIFVIGFCTYYLASLI